MAKKATTPIATTISASETGFESQNVRRKSSIVKIVKPTTCSI